jgi:hypothetical protein
MAEPAITSISPQDEAELTREYAPLLDLLRQLDDQVGRFTQLWESRIVQPVSTMQSVQKLWEGELQIQQEEDLAKIPEEPASAKRLASSSPY